MISDGTRVVSDVGDFQRDDQRLLLVVMMESWPELGATGHCNGNVVMGMPELMT